MTPEEFTASLRLAVIDENLGIYRRLFRETLPENASDPYWKRALTLYGRLSPEEQSTFFDVVRQVTVDTISNILGILDGINTIEASDAEFVLTDGSGEKLNGDLQDLFLEQEEEASE